MKHKICKTINLDLHRCKATRKQEMSRAMTDTPITIKLSRDAVYNLHDAICNHCIYDKFCDPASEEELVKFRRAIDWAIITELFIEIKVSRPTRKEQSNENT